MFLLDEVARRATPRPSLFWGGYFLGGGLFLVFLFGGFKGQGRWAKGPPHSPYFLGFVFFVSFVFWVFLSSFLKEKTLPHPPPKKRGHLCLFFSLSLGCFFTPSFNYFFLSFFLPSLFLSFCFGSLLLFTFTCLVSLFFLKNKFNIFSFIFFHQSFRLCVRFLSALSRKSLCLIFAFFS